MLITKKSPLTGKNSTLDIPVTQQQLDRWQQGRELIQNVMPDLTPEQREFLMTGYTPEDWAAMFPPSCDTCVHAAEGNDGQREAWVCGNRVSPQYAAFVALNDHCSQWRGE